METSNPIPPGYMTVGQAARKMGVTVRTLQYYDKEQLLSPSALSEGGRRLYTHKDLVQLHQILALKSLGFSLSDIKKQMVSLNTPAEVADALFAQAREIRKKIAGLEESLEALLQLRQEVLQMQSVDFKKYADIIVNLQMKNQFYFLLKQFDEKTLDHIRSHFDKDSGLDFIQRFHSLCDVIMQMHNDGVPPESEPCQQIAKQYWEMIMEFTGGDEDILSSLMKLGDSDPGEAPADAGDCSAADRAWAQRQAQVNDYLAPALELYFSRQGIPPLKETSYEKK